jgi:hypothetical protein
MPRQGRASQRRGPLSSVSLNPGLEMPREDPSLRQRTVLKAGWLRKRRQDGA